MSAWNALSWDTILLIIGLALLIPTLLALLFAKIRRFEDLGAVIGVFLLLLGGIAYFYLIPTAIVQQATLPQDYLWQDEGTVHYWERNSVLLRNGAGSIMPFELAQLAAKRSPIIRDFLGKETILVSETNPKNNSALIQDAVYDDTGEVLTVINGTQHVDEWYHVDPHTASLRFTDVDAGSMGIPANIPGLNTVSVGWVESNGERGGNENVVFVRDMHRIQEGSLNGLDLDVWQSETYDKPITWHGEPYFCDETLRLTVHPQTGYVVHVYRHLVLSAHLSQFLKLYYPEAMDSRLVIGYLRLNDPIGEAAELIYNTTTASQARHLAEAGDINNLITYIPPSLCVPMLLIGFALVWRYSGRSYYWKRYKKYEQEAASPESHRKRRSLRRVLAVVGVCALLVSTAGFVLVQRRPSLEVAPAPAAAAPLDNGIPPTPPGSSRAIDSGRHVLVPTDEGAHPLSHREWWYFNVFFNDRTSDLFNYSLVVSFNKMSFNDIRFLKRDNLFILLYDPAGTTYNFNTLSQRRGTLKAGSEGVSVHFETSSANGSYPSWQVHAEGADGFRVDLEYLADFLPVWVEGRSANLAILKYLSGDYYVPRCRVSGTVTWAGKEYNVSGIGYHDHVWQGNLPRLVTKGWDWANIHFDNGWEMYLSKFVLRLPGDRYSGAIIVSPNNRNLTEFIKFDLQVTKSARVKNLPLMSHPVTYHLVAQRDGMNLSLDIEVYNTAEIVWRLARTGMFEGTCRVTGRFTWPGYSVELHGFGLSEVTRVKYLLGLPGLLNGLRV